MDSLTVVCPQCGKTFDAPKNSNKRVKIFCSRSCSTMHTRARGDPVHDFNFWAQQCKDESDRAFARLCASDVKD